MYRNACVNLGRFLDFELPNTTFSWLKHMTPKSPQNGIFFVLNLKKFLLLLNPRNLPKRQILHVVKVQEIHKIIRMVKKLCPQNLSKITFFCFQSKLRIAVAVDMIDFRICTTILSPRIFMVEQIKRTNLPTMAFSLCIVS